MADTSTKTRTRLTPEARKNQILDVAASLIREHGVSFVTMDLVGRTANVSKPLVYNYFPNRPDLLKSLLKREVHRFHASSVEAADRAKTFEQLVRLTTRTMLAYVDEFGIVIQQLMLEPDVADVLEEIDTHYQRLHSEYLSRRLTKEFGLDADVAEAVIEIALGLSSAAGAYLERTKSDLDFVEDVLVAMLMGSLKNAVSTAKKGKIRPNERRVQAAAE